MNKWICAVLVLAVYLLAENENVGVRKIDGRTFYLISIVMNDLNQLGQEQTDPTRFFFSISNDDNYYYVKCNLDAAYIIAKKMKENPDPNRRISVKGGCGDWKIKKNDFSIVERKLYR